MKERLNFRNFISMAAPPVLYTIIMEICGYAMMIIAVFGFLPGAAYGFTMDQVDFAGTAVGALISIPVFLRMMDLESMRYPCDYRYEKTMSWKLVYAAALGFFSAAGLNRLMNFIQIERWFPGYEDTAAVLYSADLWAELLVLCVIVPIAEEILFRGVVYARMQRCLSVKAAAFWSSLFFGVFHGNATQGIYAFLLGMLLVYVKERYQTMLAPILFHMSANLFSVIQTETSLMDWMAKASELSVPFMIVEIAVCIVIIWGMEETVNPKRVKKNRQWHNEQDNRQDSGQKSFG